MKILFHSNACWAPTGYGQQCALFTPRLCKAGHDIAVSAFYGNHGSVLEWDGIRHYPACADAYGNDVLQAHASHWFGGDQRAGLVLTLLDVWVLAHEVIRNLEVACWVPVDHAPAPPAVRDFFAQTQAIPVAMSRFGQDQLREFDPLYVPHGIDTTTLCPGDKTEAREKLGIPADRFVVGMVAANKGNPSRKSFPEALEAFARFREQHPDAHLYLHTEARGFNQGVNLPNLLAALDIPPAAVTFTDQYTMTCLPAGLDRMADIYRAMDVLLNPATGEGFGIPIIEAQACGTPVIVTDFSAMPEVGATGWHVGGDRIWTYQESWQMRPDHKQLVWALGEAYQHAGSLRDDARKHAEQYDADLVMERHWLPALNEIQARLDARRPRELQVAA